MAERAKTVVERPKLRLDGLTGLRWWAAFIVFLYHVQIFAPVPGPLMAIFRQGYLGVTFFFVLSGFVLTWSFSTRVTKSTFYLRRFARIFPSHAVAWLLAVPIFYSFDPAGAPDWVRPVEPGVLALSFVLLQGWSLVPSILFAGNPAAWTLTCEAFFYAFHPFAQAFLRRFAVRGPLIAAGLIALLAFLLRVGAWVWPTSLFAQLPPPIQHAPEFILGMCVAWAIRSGWRPRVPVPVGIASLGVTVLAIAAAPLAFPGTLASEILTRFGNEIFTLACVLTIVAVASTTLRGGRRYFADRVQVRLGEWSFAFYLVHATVMYAVMRFVEPLAPSWSNVLPAAVLLVAATALAAALYHFVEKPVEKRLRTWKDVRDVRRLERTEPVPSVG